MARVMAFIDGFNVYHSIDDQIETRPHFVQYKWLNLKKLIKHFLPATDTVVDVYYFTTIAHWRPDKASRHQKYIQALKNEGVKVVLGNFKRDYKKCENCKTIGNPWNEKKTDVNISVFMLGAAFGDKYDKALLVSGDTDYVPVIEAIRTLTPTKIVGVISPMDRKNIELRKTAHFYGSISEHHLSRSVFDRVIPIGTSTIECPPEWIWTPPQSASPVPSTKNQPPAKP